MNFKVFSIFDEKAKAFLPPFFLPEVGMAVRAFKDCVDDPNHNFGKHPSDYTLFQVGTFDDRTGHFGEPMKQSIAVGVELREKSPQGVLSLSQEVAQ